jgi:hypothetical protein
MKKHINFFVSALLMIASLLFASCNKIGSGLEKNKVYHGLKAFSSVMAFLNSPSDANINIEQSGTLGGNKNRTRDSVGIHIETIFRNTAWSSFSCSVNGYPLTANQPGIGESKYTTVSNTNGRNDYFGKNVRISFYKKMANTAARTADDDSTTGTIYVPQLIDLKQPLVTQSFDCNWNYLIADLMNPARELTWDSDHQNDKGVFFVVEYEPDNPTNKQFKDAGYSSRIANAVTVDDNGSYKLAQELFQDIPLNAKIRLYVGRGNYGYLIDQNGNQTNVQVTSLSFVNGEFKYGNQ